MAYSWSLVLLMILLPRFDSSSFLATCATRGAHRQEARGLCDS
jgi:hypothetical protein